MHDFTVIAALFTELILCQIVARNKASLENRLEVKRETEIATSKNDSNKIARHLKVTQ